eukprot:5092-Hanusia_phi.AAC.1
MPGPNRPLQRLGTNCGEPASLMMAGAAELLLETVTVDRSDRGSEPDLRRPPPPIGPSRVPRW